METTSITCYTIVMFVIALATLIVVVVDMGYGILINKDCNKSDPDQHLGNACSKVSCGNGGTCTPSGTTYICTCPQGLIGKNCEISNPCIEKACMNGGSCFISDGQYVCACPDKYSGRHCEHDKGPCDGNPCLNGGICTQIGSSYRCACKRGYIGQDCDKVDPCQPNPCKNMGSCSVSDGNFQCECSSSHYGRICERDIIEESGCQNAVLNIKDQTKLLNIVVGFVCTIFLVVVGTASGLIICYRYNKAK